MTARRLFGVRRNLLASVDRRLVTGIFEPPLWYQAVRRVPPMNLYNAKHPGAIVFPEDPYFPKVYRRLPELTLDVPDMQSTAATAPNAKPMLAQQLAHRMYVLVQQKKMSEDEAWAKLITEQTYAKEIERLRERVKTLRGNLSGLTAANAVALMSSRFTEMATLRRLMAQQYEHDSKALGLHIDDAHSTTSSSSNTSTSTSSTPSSSSVADVLSPAQHLNMARAQFDSQGHQDVVQLYDCAHLRPNVRPLVARFLRANRAKLLGQPLAQEDVELLASIAQDPNHPLRRPLQPLPAGSRPNSTTVADKITAAEASQLELTQRTLEWALRNAVIEPEAALRDFVAFCLRMQILALKRKDPIAWSPYMNVVGKELWRQATVVLTCKHAKNLVGSDMDMYQASLASSSSSSSSSKPADSRTMWEELASDLNEDATKTGVKNGQQLVRHVKEQPLTEEEVEKHKMLMFFIDRAIAAYDFERDAQAVEPTITQEQQQL